MKQIDIADLHKNKAHHIALKKAATKFSDAMFTPKEKNLDNVVKSSVTTASIEDKICKAIVKVYANTYYWLDSHGDVHDKGTFTKSIKENSKNIFHLDNHVATYQTKAGNVVSVEELAVKWADLGVNKDGKTICVVGTSEVSDEVNEQVLNAYVNGEVYNHSVGMQYITLQLAIKERNKNYADENKAWDYMYPLLGNPETADELGYFWIVKEAKLKEFSTLLWDGSNSLTPVRSIETQTEADIVTSTKIEPLTSTQKVSWNKISFTN
jgi:disulfide oxidoreductase YuzD